MRTVIMLGCLSVLLTGPVWAQSAGDGEWTMPGRDYSSERITVSEDGKSFTSTIKYDQFDTAGKPVEGGGKATGKGVKLTF
ncbi:MAG: hypothetical protein ABI766_14445 [Gemmatimonadales bacterium]